MSKFTIGQPVWLFVAGASPTEGVVTKVEGSFVWCRDHWGNRIYSDSSIFARPQDWGKLCIQLDDAANHAEWCARSFRNNPPEEVQS